jgi:hypothetical protein
MSITPSLSYEQRLEKMNLCEEMIPQEYFCPLTHCLMNDPVKDSCDRAHYFEKSAIYTWLNSSNFCPISQKNLSLKDLKPDVSLAKEIDYFLQSNQKLFSIEPTEIPNISEANFVLSKMNDFINNFSEEQQLALKGIKGIYMNTLVSCDHAKKNCLKLESENRALKSFIDKTDMQKLMQMIEDIKLTNQKEIENLRKENNTLKSRVDDQEELLNRIKKDWRYQPSKGLSYSLYKKVSAIFSIICSEEVHYRS